MVPFRVGCTLGLWLTCDWQADTTVCPQSDLKRISSPAPTSCQIWLTLAQKTHHHPLWWGVTSEQWFVSWKNDVFNKCHTLDCCSCKCAISATCAVRASSGPAVENQLSRENLITGQWIWMNSDSVELWSDSCAAAASLIIHLTDVNWSSRCDSDLALAPGLPIHQTDQ